MGLTFPYLCGPSTPNAQLVIKPYCNLITSKSLVRYGWQMVSHASKITGSISLQAIFPGWGLTKLLISSGQTGLTAKSFSIVRSQGCLPSEAICPFLHAGLLIRLTVSELASAEVLADLCTELVTALEGFPGLWMRRAAQAAHRSPEDLAKQLLQPPVRLLKEGGISARLCSCCWPPGWFTCSSQGLQHHEWMCGSACKPTDLFLSHPRGHQMEGAGARMSQTGSGICSDKRQQADTCSRVDKKNMCRRVPLMATKQTNHSRLRKLPWAGNGTRKYHMCLPCFFSSLDTYGYHWR